MSLWKNNFMRLHYFFLLYLPFNLKCQDSLTLHVIDFKSKLPVVNVLITSQVMWRRTTDVNGNLKFYLPIDSTYENDPIFIEHKEYVPKSITLKELKQNFFVVAIKRWIDLSKRERRKIIKEYRNII